ncbi:hypothetical protein BD770DRAFT_402726 [Pilaira anomala]|nr:hypothetical protein BD770DRAFT_402726 [Pilaira anomala]
MKKNIQLEISYSFKEIMKFCFPHLLIFVTVIFSIPLCCKRKSIQVVTLHLFQELF